VDFEHYRSLMRQQKLDEAADFVEIGGSGAMKKVWRGLAWTMLLVAVVSLFTVLFYQFTNSLRVALVVVAGMLLYMFGAAKLAEGRFDRRNGE